MQVIKTPVGSVFLNAAPLDAIISDRLVSDTLHLEPNEQHIFNHLLKFSELQSVDMINLLRAAHRYFVLYEPPMIVVRFIDEYIATFSHGLTTAWSLLTRKTDFNLYQFKHRMLPKDIENKEWQRIAADAKAEDYPEELTIAEDFDEAMLNTSDADPKVTDSNYAALEILHHTDYPNEAELTLFITTCFELGMKRQALTAYLKFLMSPKTCHLVKNAELYKLFTTAQAATPAQATSQVARELVSYASYYALYLLRQEETILYTNVPAWSRVLFTHAQAYNIQSFNHEHIERDPHIQQLTAGYRLSNCCLMYLREPRAINDYQTFTHRFNLATGGAFVGLNLRELNAAVTGSILIPCVHKSPLERGFEEITDFKRRHLVDPADQPFLNYLEFYYPGYESLTDEEYTEAVLKPGDLIESASEIDYQQDQDQEQQAEPRFEKENKSAVLVNYNQLADIDVSITTRDHNEFKRRVLIIYNQIVKNCQHRGTIRIKEIKTIASVKYSIFGTGLPRPIEIFRTYCDPIRMVKKFHVHAVKMFYDGELTLFRACVASLLSGVGDSYKWFSCNKVPADVLLKYAQRGISVILNKSERRAVSTYMASSKRWSTTTDAKDADHFGLFNIGHPFYTPINSGIRLGLRQFNRLKPFLPMTGKLPVSQPEKKSESMIKIKTSQCIYQPDVASVLRVIEQVQF